MRKKPDKTNKVWLLLGLDVILLIAVIAAWASRPGRISGSEASGEHGGSSVGEESGASSAETGTRQGGTDSSAAPGTETGEHTSEETSATAEESSSEPATEAEESSSSEPVTETEESTAPESSDEPQTTLAGSETRDTAAESSSQAQETGAPAPTETETETLPPVIDSPQAYLQTMTLEEKVYQLFVTTPDQLAAQAGVTAATDTLKAALKAKPVGGLILFAANIQDRAQVSALISQCQAAAGTELFIAVDEEGGTVARLGRNPNTGVTRFDPMGTVQTADEAYRVGATLGTQLQELGFNLDFAPVADVNSNPNNPVIGKRAFSDDAATAASLVAACTQGFRGTGISCCLKHFPGHGDTATDSHLGQAMTYKTLDELRSCEFLPFKAGIEAGADFVMVAHISAPQVTGSELPATLSPDIITGLLRRELGFNGIVITDSLQMQAITAVYSSGTAALMAVQAGADMLLMPNYLDEAAQRLITAVRSGELSEARIDESVLRIISAKWAKGMLQ